MVGARARVATRPPWSPDAVLPQPLPDTALVTVRPPAVQAPDTRGHAAAFGVTCGAEPQHTRLD
jgi:hypothetical protein